MAIRNEFKNKASFFYVKLSAFSNILENSIIEDRISEEMDVVLGTLGCDNEVYKFKNKLSLIYLFSTTKRKRKGQLTKLLDKNLSISYTKVMVIALMKKEFYSYVNKFLEKKSIIKIEQPKTENKFENYSAMDIDILNNRNNWFPWQRDIYKTMFYENDIMKKCSQSDPKLSRRIIFLYDKDGCTGKSTFWKWLYFNNSENIGNLTIGSAAQLRSAICKSPHKNLYVCDLPRAIGMQDQSRLEDLIEALEEVKNGFLVNVMYGEHDTLVMDKPFIICCSNFIIDARALSKDRWQILEINKKKQLIDITQKVKKKAALEEQIKIKKRNGVGLNID